jgi:hypothetical protein
MLCNVPLHFSPQPKNIEESQCKTATKKPEEIEDSCKDEIYEVVEMEATSSAKARYAPAQIPQEGTATATKPVHDIVESKEKIEETTAQADVENQETYVICA